MYIAIVSRRPFGVKFLLFISGSERESHLRERHFMSISHYLNNLFQTLFRIGRYLLWYKNTTGFAHNKPFRM